MAFGSSSHVSCSGMVQTTTVLGDYPDHYRARGLPRPLPCSETVQTTPMLEDCFGHYRAQGLFRPLLGDRSPRLHVICTHIQSRGIYLDLATRLILHLQQAQGLHRYDAPVGASRITCTTIGLLTSVEILFRPWHHVPASPTTRLGD